MGIGEFLSLLCALIWALAVIYYRKSGDHFNIWQINIFKSALVLLLMIPTTFAFHGLEIPTLDSYQLLLILVSGVIGIMMADMFYIKALKMIGAGNTGITGSLYSPFVVILSYFYLGEVLNHWQYLGMVLVLAGVLIVGYNKKSNDTTEASLPVIGFIFAVLGIFFTAVGIVIIKPVTSELPFFWIILIRSIGGFVAMYLFCKLNSKPTSLLPLFKMDGFKYLVIGSLLGQYLSMMIWVAGYKYTSASVASILNETASVFILIFSWLLLKEEITAKKIVGMLFAITGVFMVLMLNS